MKKILTAFSAIDTPWHVINFATRIAKENSAVIQAVFLNMEKESVNEDYPFPNDLSITEDKNTFENISDNNNELVEENIKLFKKECDRSGISFSATKNISIPDLINETADVDLMMADSGTEFLEKVLPEIHCPAFLASRDELPENVVLMYNNTPSSKFAIESYLSLLPQFKDLPTFLLCINPGNTAEKEMNIYLKETLEPHFTNLTLKSIHGKTEHEMKNFLLAFSGHVVVVMGAFGRSSFSRFFHESLANLALSLKNISLFIAHK